VITTARGGNPDQVAHGNNGYLCGTVDDFVDYCLLMIEHPRRRLALRRNALARARNFVSGEVIRKLLLFLE
jgi:glycosyltransferase involved in cell wall biosynthesis